MSRAGHRAEGRVCIVRRMAVVQRGVALAQLLCTPTVSDTSLEPRKVELASDRAELCSAG